jgi:hypothetical protein
MSENNEFELSNLLDETKVVPMEIPEVLEEKFIDPEQDRDNWPVIKIARVKGRPNFHYCSASGTLKNGKPFNHELKVMRGVDVPVPPSIVNMLQTSERTEYEQSYDPISGRGFLEASNVPPIPWQLIKGGKYF